MKIDQLDTGEAVFIASIALAPVGLKLAGLLEWSWWWVLSPIWIPICVVLVIVVLFAVFGRQ
jgi:hypothetical protein